ncbi:MAG: acyl-CoA thioesterase [Syntrophobacterales bacterium]|nr:MAG: acyl-CoA thioesterase [Syntrophobacterales bacterium]
MNRTPVKIRAIYADTDAMGIVYHTNYIRWFEVGRTELFRDMGILYAELEAAGFNLPLTQVYCHYHLPAHYDEMVLVETEIAYLKRASMKFTCLIWDENRENLLTEGYTIHACTDRCGKIVRIPASIADKIQIFYSKNEGAKANP